MIDTYLIIFGVIGFVVCVISFKLGRLESRVHQLELNKFTPEQTNALIEISSKKN